MEIIEKLVCGQVVDPAVEIVADPPDRPRICLDGLRLQACQFQAFLVFAVILFELRILGHVGVHCNLLVEIIKPMANALASPTWRYYNKSERLQQDVYLREYGWGSLSPRSGFVQQPNAPDAKGCGFFRSKWFFNIFRFCIILWKPFALGDLKR